LRKQKHSQTPVDVKRPVGRPRRIRAKQAIARGHSGNRETRLLCKQVQGWCDWDHLISIRFP
jgi:hypothetical protein